MNKKEWINNFFLFKADSFLILILLILTLVIYFPTLNGRLFFDDEYFIVRNSYVHDFNIIKIFSESAYAGAGQAGHFYRPLQFVFHSIVYKIFNITPLPYHLLSILFHFGAASLLFFLLRDFKISKIVSFFSSLLFIAHPVNTQAVSYVSGFGEPLGLFFLLLTFLIYRKDGYFKEKFVQYLLFSISLFFSLLAKERSTVFLLLFLVVDIAFPKNDNKIKKNLRDSKIFYILSIIITGLYLLILRFFTNVFSYRSVITDNSYSTDIFVRFLSFLYAFFQYLSVIFFSFGLYSERQIVVIDSLFNFGVIFALIVLITLTFLSFYKFKTQKILFFSFFWFIVALIPSSGIFPLAYTMKEHWIYYSMIGFCFGFVYFAFYFIKNKKLAAFFLLLVIIFLSVAGFIRNIEWSNPKLFFENELRHNPLSENAIANLAYEYYLVGDYDSAIRLYTTGIEVTKSNQLAMMYYNLGFMYSLKGRINESVPLYEKSLEIDPNYIYALEELSKYYYSTGDKENFSLYYNRLFLVKRRLIEFL